MILEKIICDFLTIELGCTVLPERPKRPFGKMVFVERTGGSGQFLKQSTVAVQSYDESMFKAAELNELVKEAMFKLIELDSITKVTLNSNYNYTDTATKEYRYQAVFDIYHY